MAGKKAEHKVVAHLDGERSSRNGAHGLVASERVPGGGRACGDEGGAEAAGELSAGLAGDGGDVGVEVFGEEVGVVADVVDVELDEEAVGEGFVLAVAQRSAVVVARLHVLGSAVLIGVAVRGVQHRAPLPEAPVKELAIALEDGLVPASLFKQGKSEEGNRGVADQHSRCHEFIVGSLVGPMRQAGPAASSRFQQHSRGVVAAELFPHCLLDVGAVEEGSPRVGDHFSVEVVGEEDVGEAEQVGGFVDAYFEVHLEGEEVEVEVVSVPA